MGGPCAGSVQHIGLQNLHKISSVFWLKVKVLVAQSCLTLCDPMDCTVHGILQASGLPFPSLEDLPNPGIEPGLPHCRQILYCLSHHGSQVI